MSQYTIKVSQSFKKMIQNKYSCHRKKPKIVEKLFFSKKYKNPVMKSINKKKSNTSSHIIGLFLGECGRMLI